jgi:hypothetical protein
MGFKFYSWMVSLDDGSRHTYEFEIHEDDPWTSVLKRFGSFLEKEGHKGVSEKIENLCELYETTLQDKIDGEEALKSLHTSGDAH